MTFEAPTAGDPATPADLLARLEAAGDAERAARDRAANRTDRETLGVPAETLNEIAAGIRQTEGIDRRVLLADALWRDGRHDARILGAKILTQARIRPDDGPWSLLERWMHDVDCRAASDAVAAATARRLAADLSRMALLDDWLSAASPWTRRTGVEAVRFLAKAKHPSEAEAQARAEVVARLAPLTADTRPVIARSVEAFRRDLARHAPESAARLGAD